MSIEKYPEYPIEILWEFTLKCNKNCKYCGSAKYLNPKKSKFEDLIAESAIAEYITKVHPSEVTITGGEPSAEIDKLIECVKILFDAGIKVKILTNGHLFELFKNKEIEEKIDPYVTCYGFSVNTLDDIDPEFQKFIKKDKTTIITNFGTHNLKDFNAIAKYTTQYNCWQVQLTVGNEFQLDLDEIRELQENLNKVESSGLIKIVKADNFTCGRCQAGIRGFSITYDGSIVPCLSYRAWNSSMRDEGFIQDIVEIWKNGFKFYRNRKFVPSCKTISGIEKLEKEIIGPNDFITKLEELQKIPKPSKRDETIFVYGVKIPTKDDDFNDYNTPLVYGVFNEINNIYSEDSSDSSNSSDSSDSSNKKGNNK